MTSLVRTIAPSADPVSLADLKAHQRIAHSTEDAILSVYLSAAIERFDGRDGLLGRALISQTWALKLDSFPTGAIDIPLPPLQSITSVVYTDTAGAAQTLDAAQYYVAGLGSRGRIVPVDRWPDTLARPEAVTITFSAGYGASADDVPFPIRRAILEVAGDMYRYRDTVVVMEGATMTSFPRRVYDLVASFREPAF